MKRVLLAACLCSATAVRSVRRSGAANPLEVPNLTGYEPVEVLCGLGKAADGSPNVQGWCRNWVGCIQAKAQPAGDAAAVKSAWDPADCREICGAWPTTSKPEGTSLLAKANQTAAGLLGLKAGKECEASCKNFQESLSSCVATILFEPGKVNAMGLPKGKAPAPPAHCVEKDSPCMPDLPVQYQKCMVHKTKKALNRDHKVAEEDERRCNMIKMDMEHCKDCPQAKGGFQSQYTAFVGGCMDQLNAYHQATHPQAKIAAIPGAKGCTVH
jgi:hypothetical protein